MNRANKIKEEIGTLVGNSYTIDVRIYLQYIGAAKEKTEADPATEGRIPEIIYDRSDNPYLYDVSGPRKAKNYGKIDNDEVMNVDEQGFQADFEGEEYKVSHKNEKFSLGGSLPTKAVETSTLEKDTEQALKASSLAQEEKELAEAL
jgi:hypothetical protein